MYHKKGFTLAELLITLGIIGVVAALTLPTLIQKQQDKILISQIKKTWADINNSILLYQQDNGVLNDNSLLFNDKDSAETVAKNWAKYFQGAKVCLRSSDKGCSQFNYDTKYATRWLKEDGSQKSGRMGFPKIILSDGAIISVGTNRSGCKPTEYTATSVNSDGQPIKNPDGTNKTHTFTSDVCANIAFDVNGAKKPNQYGRDTFHFWVHQTKLKNTTSEKYLGGKTIQNILSGKDKFEYENY